MSYFFHTDNRMQSQSLVTPVCAKFRSRSHQIYPLLKVTQMGLVLSSCSNFNPAHHCSGPRAPLHGLGDLDQQILIIFDLVSKTLCIFTSY